MKTFYVLLGLTLVFVSCWAEEIENDEADDKTSDEAQNDWNKFGQCLSINKYEHLRVVSDLMDILCYSTHSSLDFNGYNGFYGRNYHNGLYLNYLYNDAKYYKINVILERLYKFAVKLLGAKLDGNLYKTLGLPKYVFGTDAFGRGGIRYGYYGPGSIGFGSRFGIGRGRRIDGRRRIGFIHRRRGGKGISYKG